MKLFNIFKKKVIKKEVEEYRYKATCTTADGHVYTVTVRSVDEQTARDDINRTKAKDNKILYVTQLRD